MPLITDMMITGGDGFDRCAINANSFEEANNLTCVSMDCTDNRSSNNQKEESINGSTGTLDLGGVTD